MPHKMMNSQIADVLHDNRLSIEAQLVANKMLIADGRGILAIPPECKHDFGEKLKRFYETADDSELQKFLIETSIYN